MDKLRLLVDTFTLSETALAGTYNLLSAAGEESVNALFDFRVDFLVPLGDKSPQSLADLDRALLGARATLNFGEGAALQHRLGRIAEARTLGVITVDDGAMVQVVVRLVPSAWFLTQRRRSRIFQQRYLWEIVSQVLTEAGVSHRWQLSNKYPRRVYCTQYDETDWAFVTRLLAEEGVFFFFEHPAQFESPTHVQGETPTDHRARAAGVLSAIGQVATKFGQVADIGIPAFGGGFVSAVADVTAWPEGNEDDPQPKTGGEGAAGPSGARDVMVFVDNAIHYPTGEHDNEHGGQALSVWLRREADMTPGDVYVATSFGPHGTVRPNAVETRDYDFRRPLVLLKATTQETAEARKEKVEGSLEMYEHHGEYETTDVTGENARNTLDQYRVRASVFRAEGFCPRVLPGHLFELKNATTDTALEGRFVPVKVVHHAMNPRYLGPRAKSKIEGLVRGAALAIHEALRSRDDDGAWGEVELRELLRVTVESYREEQPLPYRCVVECVRDKVAARPSRPEREPRNVTETATVVGPRGEEIYTDKLGRVKVQFHWDREGKWDAHSSCWVRVAQTWAGAGFGFQFVPRVGMEVLVTFLRGDPDRPVIVGTLYNGTHELPEPLPYRKTRSAIRTQSSPGGGGFNELAFEDQAGNERVLLRAQKDMELIVNDHHARTVRGGESVAVGGSQRIVVNSTQLTGIQEHQTTLVGGDHALSVRGNRLAHIAHDEAQFVDGGRLLHVGASTVSTVEGDVTLGVQGSRLSAITGDERVLVGVDETDPRMHHTRVLGTAITSAHRVELHADAKGDDKTRAVHFQVGDSALTLTHDTIELRSKHVIVRGNESVLAHGKDALVRLDDKGMTTLADPIHLNTQHGASLLLDKKSANLHGSRIRLEPAKTPGKGDSTETEPPKPNVKLKFTHGFFKQTVVTREGEKVERKPAPIAGVTARVVGARCDNPKTDPDGVLECYAAPDVKTFSVELLVHEVYPLLYSAEADPLTYLIKLEEKAPREKTPAVARLRLRNLGFEPGTALDEETLDPATEEALLEFQTECSIPRSIALDDITYLDLNRVWNE